VCLLPKVRQKQTLKTLISFFCCYYYYVILLLLMHSASATLRILKKSQTFFCDFIIQQTNLFISMKKRKWIKTACAITVEQGFFKAESLISKLNRKIEPSHNNQSIVYTFYKKLLVITLNMSYWLRGFILLFEKEFLKGFYFFNSKLIGNNNSRTDLNIFSFSIFKQKEESNLLCFLFLYY